MMAIASDLIDRAIRVAEEAHRDQLRKGTSIPYITHPLAVGITLARAGRDEEVIAAGILHDTVEDTPLTLEDIEEEFGPRVATLVDGASEPNKKLRWEERKQHTVEFLKTAPLDVRYITCADKLSNIRSVIVGYQLQGEDLWKVFRRGKDQQLWYYNSVADALVHGLTEVPPLMREYQDAVAELNRVVGE